MNTLRAKLKTILPKKIVYYYYLRSAQKACLPDLKRRVYDKVYNNSREDKLKRNLTLAYHIIEKGLTMPEPRPGFGKAVVSDLVKTVMDYKSMNLSLEAQEFIQAVSVLKEYDSYHAAINFALDSDIAKLLDEIKTQFPDVHGEPQIRTTREEYFSQINAPFDKFCMSRYSIRNYTTEPIPVETLLKCIDLAQKSPSFCNRQPTRVHIVKSPEKKKGILALQNGNRGFGELAETLLVITSIISYTKDIIERNENHLNGGIFIMTLLNALHQNKIGACSLNWSVTEDREQALRELLGLQENEIALMVVSCGFVPEEIAIASSPRKKASEITTLHT